MLTEDVLRQLYPAAKDATIAAFAAQCAALFAEFGISERQNRLHFFLAQIGHESGGLRVTEENLNYSAARLRQVWPSRFPDLASTQGFAGNPQALANKVYGGRLGNTAPTDGWSYRGRGFIQALYPRKRACVGIPAHVDRQERLRSGKARRCGIPFSHEAGMCAFKLRRSRCFVVDHAGDTLPVIKPRMRTHQRRWQLLYP